MWNYIKSFFIRTDEPAPMAPPPFSYTLGDGGSKSTPPSTPPQTQPFEWVLTANGVIAKVLSALPIWAYKETHDHLPQHRMHITSVTLAPAEEHNGGLVAYAVGGEERQNATLTVQLKEPVGNYEIVSLNHALHSMLGEIPALKGQVKFAKDAPPVPLNHEEEWNILKPLLEKATKPNAPAESAFTAAEMTALEGYFLRDKLDMAERSEWRHIEVRHANDKVQFDLEAMKLPSDSTTGISTEATVNDYVNHNKAAILESMKTKLIALKLMTPEDAALLDFTAAITTGGYGNTVPVVEFGSRVAGQEAIGATPLAKVDTDKLRDVFATVLLESSKDLPSILPRIADGAMIKQAITQRVGENPAITQALDHGMFKSWQERNAEREKDAGIVEIGNVTESSKPNELKLTFPLPHGVTLQSLRESIVDNANVIELGAKSHYHTVGLGK
jgi:hypothetical protein